MASWTMDKFMKAYTDSTFSDLFSQSLKDKLGGLTDAQMPPPSLLEVHKHMMGFLTSTNPELQNVMQRPSEDALLWSGADAPAWVACNQRNNTCYGKIAKDQWYSKGNRAKVCLNTFTEQIKNGNINSTAVGLDVCNLNRKMDELCQVGLFCHFIAKREDC